MRLLLKNEFIIEILKKSIDSGKVIVAKLLGNTLVGLNLKQTLLFGPKEVNNFLHGLQVGYSSYYAIRNK